MQNNDIPTGKAGAQEASLLDEFGKMSGLTDNTVVKLKAGEELLIGETHSIRDALERSSLQSHGPHLDALTKPISEGDVVGLVIGEIRSRDNDTFTLPSNLHCMKVEKVGQEGILRSQEGVEDKADEEGISRLILTSGTQTSEF